LDIAVGVEPKDPVLPPAPSVLRVNGSRERGGGRGFNDE